MSAERGLNWLLGIGFVVMFAIAMTALNQRDKARTATIQMDGAVVSVTCQEPTQ